MKIHSTKWETELVQHNTVSHNCASQSKLCSFFTLFIVTSITEIGKSFFSLTSEPRPAVSTNRRNRKWFSEASEWEHLSALSYWFARSDRPKETSQCDCENGLERRCETQWLRIGFYISPLIQYSLLSPCFKQTSVTCGPLGASQGGCAYKVCACMCERAHTSKVFFFGMNRCDLLTCIS